MTYPRDIDTLLELFLGDDVTDAVMRDIIHEVYPLMGDWWTLSVDLRGAVDDPGEPVEPQPFPLCYQRHARPVPAELSVCTTPLMRDTGVEHPYIEGDEAAFKVGRLLYSMGPFDTERDVRWTLIQFHEYQREEGVWHS